MRSDYLSNGPSLELGEGKNVPVRVFEPNNLPPARRCPDARLILLKPLVRLIC
jgi:hypothetical protein